MNIRCSTFFPMVFAVSMSAVGSSSSDPLCQDNSCTKIKVPNKAPLNAYAFDLRNVRLLDGPFKHAMDLDKRYLLSLDANRLLHVFRLTAGVRSPVGLPSAGRPLGGWEDPSCEVRGHFVGHYLSACAMMYASTGDERMREKGNAIVAGLAECQAALGSSGYLSAFPEHFFTRLEKAKMPPWAPYYVLHKICAGLLDMYVYCDNQQALEVCKKAGDWIIVRNARFTDEQVQQMLGTEHGGINEVLANLYAFTGEEKYLKIAQRLNHLAVLGPASKREDNLDGLHANTQIPKFIGAARQYELTGQDWLGTASSFFWESVVKGRSYVIGGNGDSEGFSPKARLSEALGPNTTETCNTYNMLKLTRHLFCWEPRVEYADFYERALYNHILASQHPKDGMMCYYVPLRSGMTRGGGASGYCTPEDAFWCCTGTGVENHAKYGDSIYFHDHGNSLYVNLFIASELRWKEKGMRIRQETKYPDESVTRLKMSCGKPTELVVRIRRPFWATTAYAIRVNGQLQTVDGVPGSYVEISRQWNDGDVIEVSMPFALRAEGFRDNPRRLAFMNGPLVLCAEVDAKLRPDVELNNRPYPGVVAENGNLLARLSPVAGRPSTFSGPADVFRVCDYQGDHEVTLEPFYKMHGNRHYVVYWNAHTPIEWTEAKTKWEVECPMTLQKLYANTVDVVDPLVEQSERDHNLQCDRSATGDFKARKWRHAAGGGWFSWDMNILPNKPHQLVVTYWGSDTGRNFDILIDGVKFTTQKLQNNRPDQLYGETYELPEDLIGGKNRITVRFQSRSGSIAGGVFECRILKRD